MAAQLKKDLDIDTALVVGNSGEFTIWIDGAQLVDKQWPKFPEPKDVVAAVRARLA